MDGHLLKWLKVRDEPGPCDVSVPFTDLITVLLYKGVQS